MITRDEYLKAKAIVNQYYKEQPWKTDNQTGYFTDEEIKVISDEFAKLVIHKK